MDYKFLKPSVREKKIISLGDVIQIEGATYIVACESAFYDEDLKSKELSSKLNGRKIQVSSGVSYTRTEIEASTLTGNGSGYNPFEFKAKGRLVPLNSSIRDPDGDSSIIQAYGYVIVRNPEENSSKFQLFIKDEKSGYVTDILNHFEESDCFFISFETLPEYSFINKIEDEEDGNGFEEKISVVLEDDLSEFNQEQVAYLHMINDFKEYIKNKFRQENKS